MTYPLQTLPDSKKYLCCCMNVHYYHIVSMCCRTVDVYVCSLQEFILSSKANNKEYGSLLTEMVLNMWILTLGDTIL